MKRAIMIDPEDTVATLLSDAEAGEPIYIVRADGKETKALKAREPISMGHKVALMSLKKGDKVMKYGAVIGQAIRHIREGDHVHVHNMKSLRLVIPLNASRIPK
jgi:hypothetical protein